MTSSVTPIELSPIRQARTDDDTLTVTLDDGRAITTPLDWYPRLAHATREERDEWRPIGDGEGIEWPAIDEHISVEGLIAGRKSGESAASFKRWLAIQEKLRQAPPYLRELRREILRVGPLDTASISRRVRENIMAYGTSPPEWRVGVAADAVERLKVLGVQEDAPAVAFQATDWAAARTAADACREAGLVGDASDADEASSTQLYAYFIGKAVTPTAAQAPVS